MIAVGEMRSFEGVMDVLSSDNLSDFISIVKSFPKATDESNNMLFLAARAGDKKARELLLLTNLRLIVSQARLYQKKKKSYELLDTIQEGIIGFWEAIDDYKLEDNEVRFTPFITKCVKNAIVEAHAKRDADIRRPEKMIYKMAKYRRLKDEYQKQGRELPSREELCRILSITSGVLKRIEQDVGLDTVSFPENYERMAIKEPRDDYFQLINEMAEKELLLYLKNKFSPYHYYALYHGVLSPDRKTYGEIGKSLLLDHNTIASIIHRDLGILRAKGKLDYRYVGVDADFLSTKPVEPIQIVKYYFFRDILDEDEKKLFRLITSSKYVDDVRVYARVLEWDISYCSLVMNRVTEKTRLDNPRVVEIFESFRETFLKKYGSKIFRLEADEPLGDIFTNAKYVAKMWAGVSYEEVKRIAQAQGIEMSRATDDLVSRYFVHEEDNAVYKDSRVAEREVNALLGGFKDVVSRSEALNFKTSDYREYNFTREKYEKIRDLCCGKMAVERIEILDMFYGVGREKLSIKQIAEEKGLEYEVAKRKLDDARVAALSVYLGKSNTKRIDAEYYIPYIENMDLDIHPTYRAMMREYIIEGKSYEEIAKAHGVTKHKVSMNILDGMFKIDLYRFGLLQKNKYSKEEIMGVLYSGLFNGEEINIVLEALSKTPVKEICAKYKTTSTKVESLMTKLSQNCFRKKVEGVDVSVEDIAREISIHPCEMVLSFQERLMLSSLYGIKCDVNPKGKQYTKEELRAAHPELKNKFNQILGNALGTVAGKKIGIVRATYSYMEREKLKKSLADPFIPISQEERELLYYAFELYGYPYKSVSTLAKERGEDLSNMRRRMQRIFVTIFKYENCEIEPAISPESDILPYLKFFSKTDQKILAEKHVDGMSNSEIAKTHGVSDNQVYNLLLRIEVHLKDLIEGTLVGFDFDYFYDCVDRDDIPFYGNKALAKKVFILYYEAHMSANEVIASLGLDCSQDVVMDVLSSLKTSVLKYKEGIRKSKMYSLEEVTSYYASHKDEMDKDQLLVYKRYFLRQKRENSSLKAISQNGVSATIAYDLMKDNGELVFDIKTATKADILEILRKHKNELSDRTVATLQKLYNIDSSEFMKGSDQMKVLRFLSNLDDNGKLLSIKQVA